MTALNKIIFLVLFFLTAESCAKTIDNMGDNCDLNNELKLPFVAQQVKEKAEPKAEQIFRLENHIVFFAELTVPTMGIAMASMAAQYITDHRDISVALCAILGFSLIKIYFTFGHKMASFDYEEKMFEFIANQFNSAVNSAVNLLTTTAINLRTKTSDFTPHELALYQEQRKKRRSC